MIKNDFRKEANMFTEIEEDENANSTTYSLFNINAWNLFNSDLEEMNEMQVKSNWKNINIYLFSK